MSFFNKSEKSNTIRLYGELFEIRIADINNDGNSDIILGIKKKVYFDQTFKKRINIYTYKDHNLQPLWLGTKFIYDIESFDVKKLNSVNCLVTFETDQNGKRFQGIYEWDAFGFALKSLNQI